jgi:hypothetical protein
MDSLQERLNRIKACAEERSNLQSSCFNELDLEGCDTGKEVGKLRYLYEKCLRENTMNYPCLNQTDEVLKGNL